MSFPRSASSSNPASILRSCFRNSFRAALDFLWPRRCEVCGRPVDRPGRHVCSDCMMRMPLLPVTGCCRRCGRDAAGLDREFLCEDCRGRDAPHFDRAASVLRYEGEARKMVQSFKFRFHHWLLDDFADMLEGTARARFKVDEIDVVTPVPITLWHRIARGYNQSGYLAAALAKRLGREYSGRLLKRVGMPRAQRTLGEEERRQNAEGTFAVRRPGLARRKTVLVVDDIMTTGATLSECARVLKAAGADRVWCISLARSIRD